MRRLLPLLVLALPALAGCAAPSEKTVDVLTTIYPLEFVATRLGAGLSVQALVPAGAEPHDWDPSPTEARRVGEARLVVAQGAGLEPWLDGLLEGAGDARPPVVRATDGLPLRDGDEGADPHTWLDPTLLSRSASVIAGEMSARFPASNASIATALAALDADLSALDAAYRDGLAACDVRVVIASHDAYGYLGARYGFDVVALSGLSPDAEPTVEARAAAVDAAREHNVSVIFFEDAASEAVARVLADEVGARAAVLWTIESLTPEQRAAGDDLLTLMRANLAALRDAMRCA